MESQSHKEQKPNTITAFQQWVKVFNDRTILMLIGLLFAGATVTVWHVARLQSELMETMALAHADLYTQALTEFRTLYTQDVVARVQEHGIKVTHDFEKDEKAIPLPATLSMKLGQSIGAHRKGAETRLYSAYPFPWRKEQGGLQDDFGQESWEFLTQHPQQPFFRFEEFNGRPSLRYATADLMRASCVDCHNHHPDTPKNDWKANDVRGVLEIIHPMDTTVAAVQTGTRETFGLMVMLGLFALGGLALVINKTRRTSWILEQRVDERTAELKKSNQELEKQMFERKQAEIALQKSEKRLRQVQKMEAIGTLAGGIAHDFNNILWVILGNTQRALRKFGNEGPIKTILDEVLTAAQRAKGLVEQILTFSRQTEAELQPLNLELVTKEVLKLLRATVPTTVEFRLDIKQDCGTILGDPTHLHQILMNLCTNAYQAMGETGILGVSLEPVTIDPRSEAYMRDIKPGAYVLLTISDTGSGIDPQTMERIYDPFFTTKEVGKGTGLGLSMVHGIVTSMGGFIKVYSEVEKGTTFRVYFPRVDAPIPVKTSQAESEEDRSHGEEILLVDDEPQVLPMVQGMLEDLGYGVTVCEDGEKALETFRRNPARFSLVITDQTMPNKSGIELAQALRQIQPDLPIVLITGFSSLISDKNYEEFGIGAYLRKPVDFGELERTVRDTLNKHRRETYAANTLNGG